MSKNYVVTDDNGNYLNVFDDWTEDTQAAQLFLDADYARERAKRNGECTHFRVVPVKITLDEETSE